MKIGIIGAGGIGRLYATLWHKAGHEMFISSRNPHKLTRFVEELGERASVGTPEEAASFGDVILLAVNYWTIDEAVNAILPASTGKLVIDATNPLKFKDGGGLERMIGEDEVAGVVMQSKLPKARIAKSLTSLWTGHVENHSNVANPTVAMPFAADDIADQQVVHRLIADAGLAPVFIGRLSESAALDPQSPVWNVVLTADELMERIANFRLQNAA